jgi:hypothetical protein
LDVIRHVNVVDVGTAVKFVKNTPVNVAPPILIPSITSAIGEEFGILCVISVVNVIGYAPVVPVTLVNVPTVNPVITPPPDIVANVI